MCKSGASWILKRQAGVDWGGAYAKEGAMRMKSEDQVMELMLMQGMTNMPSVGHERRGLW